MKRILLFILLIQIAFGQTKPIVPRANNEGAVGIDSPALHFGFGYFRGLHGDTLYWGVLNPAITASSIGAAPSSNVSFPGFGATSLLACVGNDSRLSDSRTPTSHSHGNITNAGAIGSTTNLPIITTTSGVLTTGSFGTGANTFCQGNDSRLSGWELALGNPSVSGYVLSSTTGGVRSWIILPTYQTAYTILTTFGSLSNSTGYLYNNGSGTLSYGTPTITETDPVVKAINGIVKSNGTTISVATAGTDYLTPSGSAASLTNFPTLNQNTTGTAANLSGTPALPNGTTATTQVVSDNTTKVATDAFVRLYTQPIYATATALTAGSTVTWTPILGTNIYTLTPAQTETINMGTIPSACVGTEMTLIITTSGTTAYTLTFGTNLKSQGTLSTGTTSGKIFQLKYTIYSTSAVYESSRTIAE